MPDTPKLWIVCGGGRKNPHIVGDLRVGAARQGAEVIVAEDIGLNGDAMEAEAWAYLAVRSQNGLAADLPDDDRLPEGGQRRRDCRRRRCFFPVRVIKVSSKLQPADIERP